MTAAPGWRPGERAAHREGIALLVTVVLAWGLMWPVNKVILESLTPLWAMALRSGIAAAAVFALSICRGRLALPPRGDVPVLVSITLLHMVGFGVMASWGLQIVPTGRSVVLAYTTPLWVTPGASLFLRERLTPRRMLGVAIGLAGLLVLFNPLAFDWADRRAVLGNAAILGGAVLWAASILHIRGHRWQSTPLALVPWELALASVILMPLAMLSSGAPAPVWSAGLIGMLMYAAIPGTAIAYWAIAMASRNLPAVTTALGSLGTPVVSTIIATLWLGEPLGWPLVAAIALILGGVAIGTTGEAAPRAVTPAP
ncbi:MAG TPA: DMT family transporter [Candidatus Binatia bacterium]|nr:DMT family transporter [Candidatus Binatia bacterium]